MRDFVSFFACLILLEARLPSNLRPTTRECVQLRVVTSGHVKDGRHSIRSAVNPVL